MKGSPLGHTNQLKCLLLPLWYEFRRKARMALKCIKKCNMWSWVVSNAQKWTGSLLYVVTLLYVVLILNCQDATGKMIHFYALSKQACQRGCLFFMVFVTESESLGEIFWSGAHHTQFLTAGWNKALCSSWEQYSSTLNAHHKIEELLYSWTHYCFSLWSPV